MPRCSALPPTRLQGPGTCPVLTRGTPKPVPRWCRGLPWPWGSWGGCSWWPRGVRGWALSRGALGSPAPAGTLRRLCCPHTLLWGGRMERKGRAPLDVDLDNPGAPILETRGRGRARAPEQEVWNGSGGVPLVPALLQQGHPKKGAQGHVQAAVGNLQEEPPSPEDHRGGHDLGSGWFWGRPAWPYPTGRVRGCGRCCPRSRFVRILKGICTHAER